MSSHSKPKASLAHTLAELIAPYLEPALIDAEAIQAMAAPAALLPASLSRFFGFECRLGEDAPRADFLCSLSVSGGRNRFLADPVLAGEQPGPTAHPAWERVRAFITHWQAPGNIIHDQADHLWLEFDVNGPSPTVPNFFFGTGKPPGTAQADRALILHGLETLYPHGLSPALRDALTHSLQALPPGARAFQIGLMLARPLNGVRLCLRGIPLDGMVAYLRTIGWHGNAAGLEDELRQLAPHLQRIDLDIDVSEHGVLPRIGLECYQGETDAPEPWEPLLALLQQRRLCLPEKARALQNYCGLSDMAQEGDRWPAHLRAAAELMRLRAVCVTHRSIHHIKLAFDDGLQEAKGYLAVAHQWHTLNLSAAAEAVHAHS